MARAALWTFVGFVVVAVPLVLFRLGSYHWFFRDDFYFITDRSLSSPSDLLRPHNAHWSTVPIIAFRVLWKAFGMRSYVPYQATVLTLHLTAAVLLRVIMRRAGVGPWLSTAFAGVFVLFGPGAANIVWAFQIGFTSSLVFGLTQLLLADHDGPVDRRDWLALGAGLVAVMCSGVGITLVVIVGLAMLARRGWRIALMQTAPLGAIYLLYSLTEHPQLGSTFGRPTLAVTWRWLVNSQIGAFQAMGHYPVLAVALAVLLIAGLAFALVPNRGARAAGSPRRTDAPCSSAAWSFRVRHRAGSVVVRRRERPSRVATCTSAPPWCSRRWRWPARRCRSAGERSVPSSSSPSSCRSSPTPASSSSPRSAPTYFADQERVLTTAVRMPFAKDVPSRRPPHP